jgi:hypothetical protein
MVHNFHTEIWNRGLNPISLQTVTKSTDWCLMIDNNPTMCFHAFEYLSHLIDVYCLILPTSSLSLSSNKKYSGRVYSKNWTEISVKSDRLLQAKFPIHLFVLKRYYISVPSTWMKSDHIVFREPISDQNDLESSGPGQKIFARQVQPGQSCIPLHRSTTKDSSNAILSDCAVILNLEILRVSEALRLRLQDVLPELNGSQSMQSFSTVLES